MLRSRSFYETSGRADSSSFPPVRRNLWGLRTLDEPRMYTWFWCLVPGHVFTHLGWSECAPLRLSLSYSESASVGSPLSRSEPTVLSQLLSILWLVLIKRVWGKMTYTSNMDMVRGDLFMLSFDVTHARDKLFFSWDNKNSSCKS